MWQSAIGVALVVIGLASLVKYAPSTLVSADQKRWNPWSGDTITFITHDEKQSYVVFSNAANQLLAVFGHLDTLDAGVVERLQLDLVGQHKSHLDTGHDLEVRAWDERAHLGRLVSLFAEIKDFTDRGESSITVAGASRGKIKLEIRDGDTKTNVQMTRLL